MDPTDPTTSKAPSRKAETPEQRLQRLERELLAAKRAVKDAEQRRLAILGAAFIEEAQGDAEFKARLHDILRRRVTSKTGQADVAVLLGA